MIQEGKYVRNSILIQAPIELVWDWLTKGEYTKQYMFGCSTISTWELGSELLWQGEHEGQNMIFVKGIIKKINPPIELAYTTFDPFASYPDIIENHVTVTYTLTTQNADTLLAVSQGDFSHVADGEKRFLEVQNNGEGWNPILVQIKNLIELNNTLS